MAFFPPAARPAENDTGDVTRNGGRMSARRLKKVSAPRRASAQCSCVEEGGPPQTIKAPQMGLFITLTHPAVFESAQSAHHPFPMVAAAPLNSCICSHSKSSSMCACKPCRRAEHECARVPKKREGCPADIHRCTCHKADGILLNICWLTDGHFASS